ncbi:MAG: hypothetical protein Q9174_007446 [Haloplaca sp. 1 TL-2023]
MALVKEWKKDLHFYGEPIQNNDNVYLACYCEGEKGYLGQKTESSGGGITVTVMSGVSTSRREETVEANYAIMVHDKQHAFEFSVHKRVHSESDYSIYFEAEKLEGKQCIPRPMMAPDGDSWVYYQQLGGGNPYTPAEVKFSGDGHFTFRNKENAVYVSKWGDGWYLNTKQNGSPCILVPEKV